MRDGSDRPIRIVVVGQIARDLVLRTSGLPAPGKSGSVIERIERLGGKGANQAVGLRQLHSADASVTISLVGVVGEDAAGAQVIADAVASGLDVDLVARRGGTALFVDLVTSPGESRILEDVPTSALLTVDDVQRAAGIFADADAVVLQLQQPADALLAAAAQAVEAGALVVLDGAIEGDDRDALLAMADVIRSDAHEASLLTGETLRTREDVARAATRLLGGRTKVVAFGVSDDGDLVVWAHGEHWFPHGDDAPVDPTGGGDAFTAGLVTTLVRGDDPQRAGELASAAAHVTVGGLGGRPDLGHLAAGHS